MKLSGIITRALATLTLAAVATGAMAVTGARDAGGARPGMLSAAPRPAEAAVFVGVGYGHYPRWRWDGAYRVWRPYGFYYGRPGYVGTYFAGYAPPTYAPYWWRPRPYGYPRYWRGRPWGPGRYWGPRRYWAP